ncbi:phasin family protein [Roseibium sp.]|uniref:phasin family protein n=1 Tax=Roseibium sp. TaxID=1936156 RepID=UPI003A97B6DD
MPGKSSDTPFDVFQKLMPHWPTPTFSNWAFAEREDRMEELAFSGLQRFNQTMWDRAEKALDDHMRFVSHRLHEDFECAKALSECRMPDQAISTLQDFYTTMAGEYQEHARNQLELLKDSVTESMAKAEELSEAAMETATEFGKAVEESRAELASTAPKPRRKVTATR